MSNVISIINAPKETPQDQFSNLSFEQLSEVAVSLPGSSPERVELNQQEAGKVTSVEKTVDFLSLPFEQLMRVSVHVAVFLDNDQEADKKTEAEVTSEGSGFSVDTLSVFTKQSQQGVAPIIPKVQSEEKEIQNENTNDTKTTTVVVTTPPSQVVTIASLIPLIIPQLLVISSLLDNTISILINNRNGTFSVQPSFSVGGDVYTIAIGDFNRDGLLDLAAADNTGNIIQVFLATGVGVFGPVTNISGLSSPFSIVTADFNGDGILDLACTNTAADNIFIYLGLGDGTFQAPVILPTPGASPSGMAQGDFNGDGLVDLAVINTNGATIAIFIGSGTGFFNSITNFPSGGVSVSSIITGDFNRDGLLDLATIDSNGGTICVVLGIGMGFFGSPTVYPGFTLPFFVTAGDFNKDGNLDLVVGDLADGVLYILFGSSTGVFGSKIAISAGGLWSSGAAADFNGDSNLDLAITDANGNVVGIFFGNGDGTFQNPIFYPVGLGPQFIGLGIVPAGVSGCPINLALTNPIDINDDIVTLKIHNIPVEWTLNTGINNNDGSWTVQTVDLSALTITTTPDFVGVRALEIDMSWVASDEILQNFHIKDNIEAYAPGCPIFALPTGDNLTGSIYADTFVIAKSSPLVEDVIFNFDSLEDKINLLDFTEIHQFSDLSIQNDNKGNALVSLDSGDHHILLYGVNPENLSLNNFLFNETPYTLNNHIIDIGQGAIMPFSGIFENNGTIRVDGTMVMQGELVGSGKIILGNSGVLEFNGYFNQDIVFETGSTSIVFDHIEFTLAHMTTISFQTLLEGHLISA